MQQVPPHISTTIYPIRHKQNTQEHHDKRQVQRMAESDTYGKEAVAG